MVDEWLVNARFSKTLYLWMYQSFRKFLETFHKFLETFRKGLETFQKFPETSNSFLKFPEAFFQLPGFTGLVVQSAWGGGVTRSHRPICSSSSMSLRIHLCGFLGPEAARCLGSVSRDNYGARVGGTGIRSSFASRFGSKFAL